MSTYAVSRSRLIPASAGAIFPYVNSFHEWPKWSPWESVDGNLQRTYSGSGTGAGARYEWSGNRKAGSGTMEILESDHPRRIGIRLVFTKPFKAVNPTAFTFVPEGPGTRVTWTMTGENKGIGKVFALFMNMDKMIGGDFDKGLAALADVVSAGSSAA